MRIVCLSDIHGFLPEVPDCDLLLLGGDYCPGKGAMEVYPSPTYWYKYVFGVWLSDLSKRMKVVGVAGNHDHLFEKEVPVLDWTYLQDSGTEFNGLKIWGSPWQPIFYWWAFNAAEPDLERIWAKIPDDTDILLLHGPPYGYGDKSPYKFNHKDDTTWPGYEHTGSPSLTKRILEVQPKLVVAGHVHNGHGKYQIGESLFVNASYVDGSRQACHEIIVVDL